MSARRRGRRQRRWRLAAVVVQGQPQWSRATSFWLCNLGRAAMQSGLGALQLAAAALVLNSQANVIEMCSAIAPNPHPVAWVHSSEPKAPSTHVFAC